MTRCRRAWTNTARHAIEPSYATACDAIDRPPARRADRSGAARAHRVWLALAVYLVLWTLYGTIAKSSQGLHPDMTEVIAWSRDLAWGYKHPPLAAAIAWLVVRRVSARRVVLLPAGDADADAGAVDRLAAVGRLSRHREARRRTGAADAGAVLQFPCAEVQREHGADAGCGRRPRGGSCARTATRSALYAALAGVGAAACMLGKYWSVFLLAGLGRRRADRPAAAPSISARRRPGSRLPSAWSCWRRIWSGFTSTTSSRSPMRWHVHGAKPFGPTVVSALGYLAGSFGYVAIPVIVVLIAARPNRATLADMVWPADTERRLAAAAFWGPLLLPAAAALASGTEITSLWSMSAWTLLPVLLLSPPAMTLRDIDTRRISRPRWRSRLHRADRFAGDRRTSRSAMARQPAAAQAKLLAGLIVERVWHETTPLPLSFVGGYRPILRMASSLTRRTGRARCPTCRNRTRPALRAAEWRSCVLPRTPAAAQRGASADWQFRHRFETEIGRNFLAISRQAALHDSHPAAAPERARQSLRRNKCSVSRSLGDSAALTQDHARQSPALSSPARPGDTDPVGTVSLQ